MTEKKLPKTVSAGTLIGNVSGEIAKELDLPSGIPIVMGAHDQCANALGCGVIDPGQAMLGMGTFTCAVPVYSQRYPAEKLSPLGVNTQHHAVPEKFVSLIYNQGGAVVKWFRDTFACDIRDNLESGDLYDRLFAEVPDSPSSLVMLPYFTTTGLPDFSPETSGVMTGLRLTSSRGEILKGITESIILDLKTSFRALDEIGMATDEFIAVGGGSKSDGWMQTCADILESPFRRARVTECGALGAAISAAVGLGRFPDYRDAVQAMVSMGDSFEPNLRHKARYEKKYQQFRDLKCKLTPFLSDLYCENIRSTQ